MTKSNCCSIDSVLTAEIKGRRDTALQVTSLHKVGELLMCQVGEYTSRRINVYHVKNLHTHEAFIHLLTQSQCYEYTATKQNGGGAQLVELL